MSMADRDGFIWKDGKLLPWREATTHVLTHSLHYGMGVFEGVRAYGQRDGSVAIFRLQDHTQRLFNSAKIFLMDIPWTQEQLNEAQRDVVRSNKLSGVVFDCCWLLATEEAGRVSYFQACTSVDTLLALICVRGE